MKSVVALYLLVILKNHHVFAKLVSMQPFRPPSAPSPWMPSRVNSLYSHVGPWSGKFRPVMDDLESDEALKYNSFLNYLDGASFGTGEVNEFVDGLNLLASVMTGELNRQVRHHGARELEAINGQKGNSIMSVLDVSTVITRKGRKYYCTGEVLEPIVDNKVICKDRILLPIAGTSCSDAIMYYSPKLIEDHYCVGGLESKEPVAIMDNGNSNTPHYLDGKQGLIVIAGELFCSGDEYSKREYLLACEFFEEQEPPTARLLKYYPDEV